MLDPAMITAIATLVTALTALVKILQVDRKTAANTETLHAVHHQTNGTLTSLRAEVRQLSATQATPAEQAAREPTSTPEPPAA